MHFLKHKNYALINIESIVSIKSGRDYITSGYVIAFLNSVMYDYKWYFESEEEMNRVFSKIIALLESKTTELF